MLLVPWALVTATMMVLGVGASCISFKIFQYTKSPFRFRDLLYEVVAMVVEYPRRALEIEGFCSSEVVFNIRLLFSVTEYNMT
jgi:hypothetical protein